MLGLFIAAFFASSNSFSLKSFGLSSLSSAAASPRLLFFLSLYGFWVFNLHSTFYFLSWT